MNNNKKLKPVIFIEGDKTFYRKNEFAQNLLLKALSKGVTDPNELRKVAGLRSVADVYRTLDKMAIRKEYHKVLAEQGMTLDYVIGEIKKIIGSTSSDGTKLKALQTILRSLGLDRYEKQEDSGKSWEEAIIEALKASKKNKNSDNAIEVKEVEEGEYEVVVPEVPEDEKKKEEDEKNLADKLYED